LNTEQELSPGLTSPHGVGTVVALNPRMSEPSLSLSVSPETQIQRVGLPALTLPAAGGADAFHAQAISLHRKATATEAFVTIATSCLRQIALNRAGVRRGSAEAVHQMRVGLRRLRAALSIFKSVLRPSEFEPMKRELGWLTGQLAAARESDVILESVSTAAGEVREVLAFEREISDELSRRRREAYVASRLAVESARFERLIGDSALVLIAHVGQTERDMRSARKLARKNLDHRTRRVLANLADFPRMSLAERHHLRIRVKKLRYAAEFFESFWPNAEHSQRAFTGALEALQDTLGQLNDIAAHRSIARELVEHDAGDARAGRRTAFVIGALTATEQARVPALLKSIPKHRRRLQRAPRFWD